jgi:hypothetical protein
MLQVSLSSASRSVLGARRLVPQRPPGVRDDDLEDAHAANEPRTA